MISGHQFQIINKIFVFFEDQKQVKVALCLILFMNGETLTRFVCM